ncbi:hypothetical protein SBA4_1580002 [Candidatus Sulfopaludibacter sp. SbA4]|nr:hypothetical protein SBA4_1580002 [Candidatus Sulfopaludibacter sp. SbA4]
MFYRALDGRLMVASVRATVQGLEFALRPLFSALSSHWDRTYIPTTSPRQSAHPRPGAH